MRALPHFQVLTSAAAASLLMGCAGAPAVRDAANPQDRAQRSITNFTPALRCMDDLKFSTGRRDITMVVDDMHERFIESTGAASNAAGVDRHLVDRWTQESIINSSGGAGGLASFTTVRTLFLAGDGRVRQSVRSAGGGGTWSHASGESLEFSGRWQVRGRKIWVQPDGYPQYVAAGRYALIDGRLVVYDGRGWQIWSR